MNMPEQPDATAPLPAWAKELVTQYESGATNQFILHGNVDDVLVLPLAEQAELGTLSDFLLRVLLPRFAVVLSYDLGNGIRVVKGGQTFSQWPLLKERPDFPRQPRAAVEFLTQYFRYTANLAELGHEQTHVACVITAANLVAPQLPGGMSYDLDALALLMRGWSTDSLLTKHPMATFLVSENLNDLHALLATNTHSARIKVPMPTPEDFTQAFTVLAPQYPIAVQEYTTQLDALGQQLTGATLGTVQSMLKTKNYTRQPIMPDDLVQLKKQLVEGDSNGLVEFIESKRTLEDFSGQEKVKTWIRQDIALWKRNDIQAMPMGYLLCGPVGTGKTFLIECLAGEAGVPIVKLKNFRDKWVGSTEGNLEKIFRLLHALGRCIVFVDEADQSLGKRDAGTSDAGLSGRIYSMFAEEMSNTQNRGKILWVLASSRPDLIEVDLKRPGRIDVKIPIFPTTTEEESFRLLQVLCKRRGTALDDSLLESVRAQMPLMLTPGAAEALAVKLYRVSRTTEKAPADVLCECLDDYQNPVSPEVMAFQIDLAVREASDLDFVPPSLRPKRTASPPTEPDPGAARQMGEQHVTFG